MSNRKLEYVNKTIQVSDITIKNVPKTFQVPNLVKQNIM